MGMYPYECRNIMRAIGMTLPFFTDCRVSEDGTMFEHHDRELDDVCEDMKMHTAQHLLILHSVGVINRDHRTDRSQGAPSGLFMDRKKISEQAASVRLMIEIDEFLLSAYEELSDEHGGMGIANEVLCRGVVRKHQCPIFERLNEVIFHGSPILEATERVIQRGHAEEDISPMDV